MTWSNVRIWKLRCNEYPCPTEWLSTDDQIAWDALQAAVKAGWDAQGTWHRCPEHVAQRQQEAS